VLSRLTVINPQRVRFDGGQFTPDNLIRSQTLGLHWNFGDCKALILEACSRVLCCNFTYSTTKHNNAQPISEIVPPASKEGACWEHLTRPIYLSWAEGGRFGAGTFGGIRLNRNQEIHKLA
jgi:hypothetical protein